MGKIAQSGLNRSIWLSLSITASILFSFGGLKLAFQNPYIVQDDARQHVFWMQRFIDPGLFPDDLIADYFQSVSPLGYKNLYQVFAAIGVNPLFVNKLLPLFLGIIATVYCFKVCLQIFPVPLAGLISSLLLNQNLWMVDDLSSGTPRAFIYPLFLAFLYYLLKRSFWFCLGAIALQGLFYPQAVLISLIVLLLQLFTGRRNYRLVCAGIATALAVLIVYAAQDSQFSSVITASAAINLPEFLPEGRTAFFTNNPVVFWLVGERSGILPREWQYVLLFSFGGFLPVFKIYPHWFPLAQKINRLAIILLQVLFASLIVFFLAHLLLFRLHLPSRYTQHSLRILLALADGIFITIVLDSLSAWIARRLPLKKAIIKPLIGVLGIALMLYPSYLVQAYPYRLGYVEGKAPSLYQFFKQQPQATLIASLTEEADFIPSFSGRSVLVSQEYSVPYHTGYYSQLRQRTIDLINAQYSSSFAKIKQFIAQYGVDFWLIDKKAFDPKYIATNPWLMQFQPAAANAIDKIQQEPLALPKIIEPCSVFENQDYVVLEAQCILSQ